MRAADARAELAPGVGEATDLIMLGPQIGSTIRVRDDVLREVTRAGAASVAGSYDPVAHAVVDRATPR